MCGDWRPDWMGGATFPGSEFGPPVDRAVWREVFRLGAH
jgi:hypothetical protein